ncbi:MAG: type II toxin-antitoxin system prevent-host-death family antitoxin [Thermoleophilaceae bacterium]
MTSDREIPQRELRNDIARVLREAEAGASFTVTVRGRPVARLGPLEEAPGPRTDIDRETLGWILSAPVDSERLAADLDAAEPPIEFE